MKNLINKLPVSFKLRRSLILNRVKFQLHFQVNFIIFIYMLFKMLFKGCIEAPTVLETNNIKNNRWHLLKSNFGNYIQEIRMCNSSTQSLNNFPIILA